MMRMVLLLGFLLPALAAPPAAAQTPQAAASDPVIEAQVRKLASELRCPVCQGVSINESPTELANQMKEVIRGQLQEGRTPAEVKSYFVSRYGEWILLEPQAEGFNLVLYVLPLLGLLVGLGVIAVSVRRWTKAPSPSEVFEPAGASTADDL